MSSQDIISWIDSNMATVRFAQPSGRRRYPICSVWVPTGRYELTKIGEGRTVAAAVKRAAVDANMRRIAEAQQRIAELTEAEGSK